MKSPYINTYDLVLVGNGTPSDNLSDIVDAAKQVVRFDDLNHFHTAATGHRTTQWFVSDKKQVRTRDLPVAPDTYNPHLQRLAKLHDRPARHGRWTTLGLFLLDLRKSGKTLKRTAVVNPGTIRSYERLLLRDLEAAGLRVFNSDTR